MKTLKSHLKYLIISFLLFSTGCLYAIKTSLPIDTFVAAQGNDGKIYIMANTYHISYTVPDEYRLYTTTDLKTLNNTETFITPADNHWLQCMDISVDLSNNIHFVACVNTSLFYSDICYIKYTPDNIEQRTYRNFATWWKRGFYGFFFWIKLDTYMNIPSIASFRPAIFISNGGQVNPWVSGVELILPPSSVNEKWENKKIEVPLSNELSTIFKKKYPTLDFISSTFSAPSFKILYNGKLAMSAITRTTERYPATGTGRFTPLIIFQQRPITVFRKRPLILIETPR